MHSYTQNFFYRVSTAGVKGRGGEGWWGIRKYMYRDRGERVFFVLMTVKIITLVSLHSKLHM